MRAAVIAITVALASATSGCRSCADDAGSAAADARSTQPAMPSGMLVPVGPSGDAQPESSAGLRIARHMKSGPWTELQVAAPGDTPSKTDFQHWRDDSLFVSLDAMTLMHEPFARALPGFDLFLPRLYDPDALVKLSSELDAFARTSSGPIADTARELSKLAKDAAAKRQSLWVLGV